METFDIDEMQDVLTGIEDQEAARKQRYNQYRKAWVAKRTPEQLADMSVENKQKYYNNREKRLEELREWRAKNKDKVLASRASFVASGYNSQWYKDHQAKQAQYNKTRYAKVKNVPRTQEQLDKARARSRLQYQKNREERLKYAKDHRESRVGKKNVDKISK